MYGDRRMRLGGKSIFEMADSDASRKAAHEAAESSAQVPAPARVRARRNDKKARAAEDRTIRFHALPAYLRDNEFIGEGSALQLLLSYCHAVEGKRGPCRGKHLRLCCPTDGIERAVPPLSQCCASQRVLTAGWCPFGTPYAPCLGCTMRQATSTRTYSVRRGEGAIPPAYTYRYLDG